MQIPPLEDRITLLLAAHTVFPKPRFPLPVVPLLSDSLLDQLHCLIGDLLFQRSCLCSSAWITPVLPISPLWMLLQLLIFQAFLMNFCYLSETPLLKLAQVFSVSLLPQDAEPSKTVIIHYSMFSERWLLL